jgi:hypothetical protein
LLAPRPADESTLADWIDRLGLDAPPAIWADRGPQDGEPAVYACRSFVCSPPQHELAEALDWARTEFDDAPALDGDAPF